MAEFIILEGSQAGKIFTLKDETMIGSKSDATLCLADSGVLQEHVKVKSTPHGFYLEKVSPQAIVYANGIEIQGKLLKHGDVISIGEVNLLFSDEARVQEPVEQIAKVEQKVAEKYPDIPHSVIEATAEIFEDPNKVIEIFRKDKKLSHHLETLYRICNLLNSSIDFKEMINHMLDILLSVFLPDRIFILLYDKHGRLTVEAQKFSEQVKTRGYTRVSSTILKQAVEQREAILSKDIFQDKRFMLSESIAQQNIQSVMCAPVIKKDKILGAIQIDTITAQRFYSEDDLRLINAISAHFAMALDNVMLYDKSVKYNRMLIQLENATREINSFLEIIPIVFESDKHALEIFECAGCSIFLYEEPEKAFTLYYSNTVPQSEWGRIKINEKTQICQKLFQKDKINLTPTDKVQIVELSKFFNNYAIVSLIAIPKKLKEQIRPVGIIIASDKLNGEPFDEIDLEVLSIFASQLAVSLENARLFEKATHDPLTNLYNRNYLMVKLEEYMQECKNYANALSVLFADIDHFKPINDRFGHSFGDIVLKGIADIMKKVIADKGFVSRYGGEEFVIVLPYIDVDVAEKLAEQICRDIKATKFKMAKKETSCTISFGIVRMRKDDTPETILQRADSSMYQSKLKGRDRITVGK